MAFITKHSCLYLYKYFLEMELLVILNKNNTNMPYAKDLHSFLEALSWVLK